MAGAIIVIDQPSGAGAGSPGVARNDLWKLQQINLSCASSNTTYQWDLLDVPPGSGATITGPSTSTPNFLPDLIGTYRIQLITNGGGPGNVQILILRVRYSSVGVLQNRGWAPPAFGEQSGESNYAGNLRGWAEDLEFIFSDALMQITELGNPFAAAGDLAGTSTNQMVVGLRGRALKNAAPNDQDVLTWVVADNAWGPKASTGSTSAAPRLFFDFPGYFDANATATEATGGNFSTGYTFQVLDQPVNGYTHLTFYTSGSGKTWTITISDHTGATVTTGSVTSTGHKVSVTVAPFTLAAYQTYKIWAHCSDGNTYLQVITSALAFPWQGTSTNPSPYWTFGGVTYETSGYTAGNAVAPTIQELGHWSLGFEP